MPRLDTHSAKPLTGFPPPPWNSPHKTKPRPKNEPTRSPQPEKPTAKNTTRKRKNDNSKIFLYTNPPSMTTLKEIRKDAIEIGYIDNPSLTVFKKKFSPTNKYHSKKPTFCLRSKSNLPIKRIPRIGVFSSLIPSLVSYLKTKIHPVWSMSKKHNGCARISKAKAA